MDKLATDEVKNISNFLKSKGCSEVYLFGSYASGSFNINSDIDIGIRGLPPSLFFKVYAELFFNISSKVDLFDLDADPSFSKILLEKGGLKLV